MNYIKKNQVVIWVIALMLIAAGYLSYMQNDNSEETIAEINGWDSTEYASIGDARLVNSNGIVDDTNEISSENEMTEENNNIDMNESINTNSKVTDEYFTESKLSRDKMYSQMIEAYEKILKNENISSDQKTIAQTEIKNINDCKNKIMICENLLKTKNIEESVIFINGDSISVVVKQETLSPEQIAQIQNIINREMQVEISNIHISNK